MRNHILNIIAILILASLPSYGQTTNVPSKQIFAAQTNVFTGRFLSQVLGFETHSATVGTEIANYQVVTSLVATLSSTGPGTTTWLSNATPIHVSASTVDVTGVAFTMTSNSNGKVTIEILDQVTNSFFAHLFFEGTNVYPAFTSSFSPFTNYTAGVSQGVTVDAPNGTITVPVDGSYYIYAAASFSGGINESFESDIRTNASTVIGIGSQRKLGTGGDVGTIASAGILTMTNGTIIDYAAKSLDASADMTVSHLQFGMMSVLDTSSGGSGDLTAVSNHPNSILQITASTGPVPGFNLSTGMIQVVVSNAYTDADSGGDITDVTNHPNSIVLVTTPGGPAPGINLTTGAIQVVISNAYTDVDTDTLGGTNFLASNVGSQLVNAINFTGNGLVSATVTTNAGKSQLNIAVTNTAGGGGSGDLTDVTNYPNSILVVTTPSGPAPGLNLTTGSVQVVISNAYTDVDTDTHSTWWTNAPTSLSTFPTNTITGSQTLGSTDGTNYYWVTPAGSGDLTDVTNYPNSILVVTTPGGPSPGLNLTTGAVQVIISNAYTDVDTDTLGGTNFLASNVGSQLVNAINFTGNGLVSAGVTTNAGKLQLNVAITNTAGGSGDITDVTNHPNSILVVTTPGGPAPGLNLTTGAVQVVISNSYTDVDTLGGTNFLASNVGSQLVNAINFTGNGLVSATVTTNAGKAQLNIAVTNTSGGGGGNWWTNAPTTLITATTNTHSGTQIITSTDGTNLYWKNDADSGGGVGGGTIVQHVQVGVPTQGLLPSPSADTWYLLDEWLTNGSPIALTGNTGMFDTNDWSFTFATTGVASIHGTTWDGTAADDETAWGLSKNNAVWTNYTGLSGGFPDVDETWAYEQETSDNDFNYNKSFNIDFPVDNATNKYRIRFRVNLGVVEPIGYSLHVSFMGPTL